MGPSNLSRRSFLKTSAATATGAAPLEPVMAYVHNAEAGEVTILKGTSQTTYNDPALVKRLLAAAPGDDA